MIYHLPSSHLLPWEERGEKEEEVALGSLPRGGRDGGRGTVGRWPGVEGRCVLICSTASHTTCHHLPSPPSPLSLSPASPSLLPPRSGPCGLLPLPASAIRLLLLPLLPLSPFAHTRTHACTPPYSINPVMKWVSCTHLFFYFTHISHTLHTHNSTTTCHLSFHHHLSPPPHPSMPHLPFA